MNVFVTSGTGFVGREIVAQLAAGGHKPIVLARNRGSLAVEELATRTMAKVVPGDVFDRRSLESMAGADAVIHLVGIIREAGETTFENVHFQGTRNVIAAAQMAGVRRLVQMSALGTRESAVSRYHKTKWQAEEAVRQSGLDYTIFRPSIIYGPGDQFVNQFAQIARWSPFVPVIGDGQGTLQPIEVSDVAQFFVRSLTEPKSIGQTFDLCGPEVLTFNQVLDVILAQVGRKRMKVHLPLPLARMAAASMEVVLGKVFRVAPPLNRDQIIMLQEKTVGNCRPAIELFGIRPIGMRDEIRKVKAES